MRSSLDQLRSALQRIDESRTRCRQVESPCTWCAKFVLDKTGRGWKRHVRRHSADNDGLNFRRRDSGVGECSACRFTRNIRCAYAFVDEMALANSSAFLDPLVVGLDHL